MSGKYPRLRSRKQRPPRGSERSTTTPPAVGCC
jgi:hypothetical protein